MFSDNKRKRVAAQLGSYYEFLGRSFHILAKSQCWSRELVDQGDQQTGEDGKRGKIQAFVPGRRDILEQDPAYC